jgi:hypothetical protein
MSSDCVVQPGDYSQPTGRAAPRVPRRHYLPIRPRPYDSLTPTELAAFGIGPARVSSDDDDEVQAGDNKETEDDE